MLATAALDRMDPAALRESGVDLVRAIVFSQVSPVHDRIAGRQEALVRSLITMRALGVPLELEMPLLPRKLADPRAIVSLVLRAVGSLRAFHVIVPTNEVPPSLAPPRFDEVRDSLREAVSLATEAGAEVRFDPSQGIVPCAFADDAEMHELFTFRPSDRALAGRALTPACASCALRATCGGPTLAYRSAHGDAGLSPFASRPPRLDGRPRAKRPRWGPSEREAARHVRFVVMRPTVHCNQDCLFCSANESSQNAFSDPKTMLKAVARMAQRGVRRISFSGGEPTLSPDLVHFIRAANRCGIPEIEIVTNGVLLDRESKVKRLADAGLTHAFVSLHAHDETISRMLTQKDGDHARTLKAIELLLASGVLVAVNHVITERNLPYLRAFVDALHARFGGSVFLSFAFVTPQYKALEHPHLWPRLSETKTHLMHALHRAIELRQPVVVGSRQGVPPCMLGPFAAWSDIFDLRAEAASEDAPQKLQGPPCQRCRYRGVCNGLWRPYAERFGFDELTPLEGEPFDEQELNAIRWHNHEPPWGVPLDFEDISPVLRDREAERAPLVALPSAKLALPLHRVVRTRALRVLWVGSGRRAIELAERAASVDTMAITAVASPHAPDSPHWRHVPAFRDVREAIEETRPEAAVIAAATETHLELARACIDAGVPVLLEKPVARTLSLARELEDLGGWVSCASQDLFAPGLEGLRDTQGVFVLSRRVPPEFPDAPRAWGRAPLFETLHHLFAPIVRARGSLERVLAVQHEGGSRPERLRARLSMEMGEAELRVDFGAAHDELTLEADRFSYRRIGRAVTRDGNAMARDASDEERMLRAFARAIVEESEPPVPLREGVRVQHAVEVLIDALEQAGAPLHRPNAPKHVASKRYRIG